MSDALIQNVFVSVESVYLRPLVTDHFSLRQLHFLAVLVVAYERVVFIFLFLQGYYDSYIMKCIETCRKKPLLVGKFAETFLQLSACLAWILYVLFFLLLVFLLHCKGPGFVMIFVTLSIYFSFLF